MAIFLEMREVLHDLGGGRRVGRGDYEVLHDGEVICQSREPFLAGCRALLARGLAGPGDVAEIRRVGQVGYSLRGRVGKAAGLAVENGRFVPFRDASRERVPASPASFSEVPATPIAPDHQKRPARLPAALERDARYSSMWRIRYTDGTLSDMVNLARAMDASGLGPSDDC